MYDNHYYYLLLPLLPGGNTLIVYRYMGWAHFLGFKILIFWGVFIKLTILGVMDILF